MSKKQAQTQTKTTFEKANDVARDLFLANLGLYGKAFEQGQEFYNKTQQSFHVFKCPVASICLPPSNQMFGNVFLNARTEITKIIEKPKGNNLGNYVLSGVFILPASFFKLLESTGNSMEKA